MRMDRQGRRQDRKDTYRRLDAQSLQKHSRRLLLQCLAEDPEHLLIAERGRDALSGEASCRVQFPVEPTRAAGTPVYLVDHAKQGEVFDTGVAGVQGRGGENDV